MQIKNNIHIPKNIIIASHNLGKVKEINILLNDIGIKALPISSFSNKEPIENGNNFKENALIKARSAKKLSKMASLADDSGLCIDALNGDPGIYSARWAGKDKNFKHAMAIIEEKLVNFDNKKAHFICALALVTDENKEYLYEGRVDGTLTFPPRGQKGFGYDPIFIPNNKKLTFGEMDPKQKNLISHRTHAFNQFKEHIIVK